jgi:hypothetical protein
MLFKIPRSELIERIMHSTARMTLYLRKGLIYSSRLTFYSKCGKWELILDNIVHGINTIVQNKKMKETKKQKNLIELCGNLIRFRVQEKRRNRKSTTVVKIPSAYFL